MEENELIVTILPNTIQERDFKTKNRPIRWIFFGKKYFDKFTIKKGLSNNFSELDISRLLEEVADEIRIDHVGWIDEINQKYGSEPEWWFGNIASRNMFSSNLFQYCCYLCLLEKLWSDPTLKPSLIIVDSPGLAFAIVRWAQKRKIQILFRGEYKGLGKKLIRSGKFCIRWLDFFVTTTMRRLASVTLNDDDIMEKSHSCDIVMINTFVHDSSISDAGVFEDRYFPFLHEYLKKHNKIVLIHPIFHGFRYNFFPIYKKISRSTDKFIIQEQYLKWKDYIYAWLYPIHLLRQNIIASEFHGFDLSYIIREDQMSVDLQNVLQAILTLRLMQRLKEKDLKLNSFIDWYENQALNRAIVRGLHDVFPEVRIIGAQIFLHFPNFLRSSPSTSEVKAGVVPDILLTTSQYHCRLARAFFPPLNCTPAAALRYSHVFSNYDQDKAGIVPRGKNVLVLTSFNQDETLELLLIVRELTNKLGDDISFQIRFHPDISIAEIIKQFPEIQKNRRYSIFYGSLSEGIRNASVVVSKGSGAIVEAVVKGKPSILIGNQNTLTLNPLAGINTPLYTECYSEDEVLAAILKYLSQSEKKREDYRNLGKSLRDRLFLPVNEETLAPFLAH